MDPAEERRYAHLSPFELKNKLVELAKHRSQQQMLNAGRANPNWVVLEPRAAFFLLGRFALSASEDVALAPGFGGLPKKRGIAGRLEAFLECDPDAAGSALIRDGIALARRELDLDPDLLVAEWVDAILGDHYPLPGRMLAGAESMVRACLGSELFGGAQHGAHLDLFAVEGATAGIAYAFQSLVESGLLSPGDRIAIGTPIFTPYLDLPRLPAYGFDVVEVNQDEWHGWRYPASELAKLGDPSVRAFLAVNPSNPTAAAMDAETLDRVGRIARERPDLIVITDDVYAPFSEGFRSLAAVAPRNTLVIYSFSKFWGATGWRLGVVALARDNLLDERIAAMPGAAQARFDARYASISVDPRRMKLIDRMVADSRAVGLNHTAGLSGPQQAMMSLMALAALVDASGALKRIARGIVRRRYDALYAAAGLAAPAVAGHTGYYATIDIPALARERYGDAFAAWLTDSHEPIDFVVRLAEERGVVLMDGGGFDAPRMSVRVSLANLPDEAYGHIGRAIGELLAAYHARWHAERRGG